MNSLSQNKPSTCDAIKLYMFHNRKGHSTEECWAILRYKNKKEEENRNDSDEEVVVTPKKILKQKSASKKSTKNHRAHLQQPLKRESIWSYGEYMNPDETP